MSPTISDVTIVSDLMEAIKLNFTDYELSEAGDHVKVYLKDIWVGDYDKEVFFGEYHKTFPSIKDCGFFDKKFYNLIYQKN